MLVHKRLETSKCFSMKFFCSFSFTGLFLVLCWLTLLLGFSHAADLSCTYYQELAPSDVYYLYNPNYPYLYRGQQSCLWTMKSDYKINITCDIELPQVRNFGSLTWACPETGDVFYQLFSPADR